MHDLAIDLEDHIFTLGWELLPHAAYSPDLASSNYYLFRSHHLADTHFVRFEEIRKCIDDFPVASKSVSFYRQEIRKLPERWQKVVDANGEYFLFCFWIKIEFYKKSTSNIVYRWPLFSPIFRAAYESRVEKTAHRLRRFTYRSNFWLLHQNVNG